VKAREELVRTLGAMPLSALIEIVGGRAADV
jgi:hypothetical protein